MRKLLSILLVCVLALCAASCRQEPKKGKIGISVLTMTNPFFKEIADVFTEEMGKHGYSVLAVSSALRVCPTPIPAGLLRRRRQRARRRAGGFP